MAQKTLLALGGSRLLMPIIRAVHELGHKVVTADYLPDNHAHAHADDYRNISIVDKDLVLETACEVKADGIISFAADPGVIAAAYAAEQLGLPMQTSHEAARILQRKDLFREYLTTHGFASPQVSTITSASDIASESRAITYPVIVKPVDAAGSKGVTRVESPQELEGAVAHAVEHSLSRTVIVETYIATTSPQISAECFNINGKFVFNGYMDQIFDTSGPNPYAPAGNIYPSQANAATIQTLTRELQRLSDLMGFGSGIFNIEARISESGTPYLLEVSPRGGGNRLAEFLTLATGYDLALNTVRAALGEQPELPHNTQPRTTWFHEVLVSRESGFFNKLTIDAEFERTALREVQCWPRPGDPVQAFTHASFALGTISYELENTPEPRPAPPYHRYRIEISTHDSDQ